MPVLLRCLFIPLALASWKVITQAPVTAAQGVVATAFCTEVFKGDLCIQEDVVAPEQRCPSGFSLSFQGTEPWRSLLGRLDNEAPGLRSLGIFGRGRKSEDDDEAGASFFEKPDVERKKPFAGALRASQHHSGYAAQDNHSTGIGNLALSPAPSTADVPESPAICISNDVTPARPSCPPGHRLENSVCVSEIVEAVEMQCGDSFHYDLAANSCVQESLIPSNSECPDGYRIEGNQCVVSEVQEAQRACRDGFTYQADEDMCVKILREPPRLKCPGTDNFFDGRNCEKRLTVDPTHNCPAGRLMNDACLIVENKPAVPVCPSGASLDKKLMKCLSSTVAPVKYYCSQGDLTEEKTCLNRKTRAVQAVCPDGFDQRSRACVKEKAFQPVASCPEGAALVGADCLLQEDTTPQLTCGPGFELRGEKCVMAKKVAPLQTCATGYTPYKDKCIKQTRRSGQITCPDTFTYDGTQCVVNDQQKPIYVCPEGYIPDGDAGECAAHTEKPAGLPLVSSIDSPAVSFDEKKKTGLQIMSLGRRKPQFMMSS
ncbi:putative oocyst wall protein [Neospora caninum Liverpool]|uniref:Putative oocyst wall protein n=1 Tax=Neospora caninum (strain Liverpool) TaxID=572307 RepID=F0VJU6_NEOCL|nr:putative oocyst wall protein [Neospora caninum Liverpool]CBZ54007.1 putative oocyst wall protein [Neospora caninum Liverpool]|eukprot:XP_003884039.1 putative oocyst wall protein [Neospora caninum Liverpool]